MTRPDQTRSAIDRVLDHIDIDIESGCWLWQLRVGRGGYGLTHTGSRRDGTMRTVRTHRLTYEHFVGPIPPGLELDHLCRVRHCCCPWHLEAVTRRENLMRGETVPARRAAQTHCLRGHAFTPENTYVDPRGRRTCRTCGHDRGKR